MFDVSCSLDYYQPMTFSEKYVRDSVRAAEQIEIRDSEARWVGDLADILTTENLRRGISLDLGGDQAALGELLRILDIEARLALGELAINTVTVSDELSTSHFGSFIPTVGEVGLIDGLDALQSLDWQTRTGHYDAAIIAVQQPMIVSRIGLNTPALPGGEGFSAADDTLSLEVSAAYRYQPVVTDEYDNIEDLGGLHSEFNSAASTGRQAAILLAQYVKRNEMRLYLPRRNYAIRIGRPYRINGEITGSIDVRGGSYVLDQGRLLIVPEPIDED